MIKRMFDPPFDLSATRSIAGAVTDGPGRISTAWLLETGAVLLGEETGGHFDVAESQIIANAFTAAKFSTLLAIVVDDLITNDEIYTVEATAADLNELSAELTGIGFLLINEAATHCILSTVSDYRLVAGPLAFVTDVVGDPGAAKEHFEVHAADQDRRLRPLFDAAIRQMGWV